MALEEALLLTLPLDIFGTCRFCDSGMTDGEDSYGKTHTNKRGETFKCLWHEEYKERRELLKVEKN